MWLGILWSCSRTPGTVFGRYPNPETHPRMVKMMVAIHHLLDIRAVKWGQGVCSIFFLVPKKNSKVRAILNLKWLNHFLIQCKLKIETWCSIVASTAHYVWVQHFTPVNAHMPLQSTQVLFKQITGTCKSYHSYISLAVRQNKTFRSQQ